jgi:hypothetical protein
MVLPTINGGSPGLLFLNDLNFEAPSNEAHKQVKSRPSKAQDSPFENSGQAVSVANEET